MLIWLPRNGCSDGQNWSGNTWTSSVNLNETFSFSFFLCYLYDSSIFDHVAVDFLVFRLVLLLFQVGRVLQEMKETHFVSSSLSSSSLWRGLNHDSSGLNVCEGHLEFLKQNHVANLVFLMFRLLGLPELFLSRVATHRTNLKQAVWVETREHLELLKNLE